MAQPLDERAKSLIKRSDYLFGKKVNVDALHQEIAENFYPERATFNKAEAAGRDFAQDLYTSYPLLVRRDLGNAVSAMLRPTNKEWMHTVVRGVKMEDLDHDARAYLQRMERVQRRHMLDRKTQFSRAVKESDHDFVTFGQCVITAQVNDARNGLLYRTHHLRDVAWCEDVNGLIVEVYHRWKITADQLCKKFPQSAASQVQQIREREPYREIQCLVVVVPAELYPSAKKWIQPFVKVTIDAENSVQLEEVGLWNREYVIPRFMTVSGSQYGVSPATIIALPDARLLQSMTRTLLEAGEKYVNPPMWAYKEAVRGDLNIFAGGLTYVEQDYDERSGQPLNILQSDKSGMPIGFEMQNDARGLMRQAFFLDKLDMPPAGGPAMTAYEVGQRVQEHIRTLLPLFEPMETDYNGELCEFSGDLLLRNGAFGPREAVPESLRGADVTYSFESPLHDAIEAQKGQLFLQSKALLAAAMELDPAAGYVVDSPAALRDALQGIAPEKWLRSQAEIEAMKRDAANQQATQQALTNLQTGADAAQKLGAANQAFQQ